MLHVKGEGEVEDRLQVVEEIEEDMLLGVAEDRLQVVGEVEDRMGASVEDDRGQAAIGAGGNRG